MINELEYIGELDMCYHDEGGFTVGGKCFEEIADEIEGYFGMNPVLNVSYLISDVKLTKEQFLENRLMTIFGAIDLECVDVHGSEWTGYMWTKQKFTVGEHDLLKELTTYSGKYCYLKIYNLVEKRNMQINNILDDK